MYFSDMFCYGDSHDVAGFTGIVGCMGIAYAGPGSIYAIHIPPDSKALETQTYETFVRFIKNNNGNVGRAGHLFGFVNGINRTLVHDAVYTAEESMQFIKKKLGSPRTTLYRIMKHLGQNSGTALADAVAIMIERVHVSALCPEGFDIFYKRHAEITWVAAGEPPTGQYKSRATYIKAKSPSDLVTNWRRATADNCTVTRI